jgi:hypothetical protein
MVELAWLWLKNQPTSALTHCIRRIGLTKNQNN